MWAISISKKKKFYVEINKLKKSAIYRKKKKK
jgi:hypothetical protein